MYTDDPTRTRQMLDAARAVRRHVQGRQPEALEKDELLRLALLHLIQTVGEASRFLSSEMKERHPEVPWGRLQRIRHRIVHNYTEVDLDILWMAASESLPELIPRLESILAEG